MTNVRANMANPGREKPTRGPQGKMDVLETPEHVVLALLDHVPLSKMVLEPAAGSGRIVKVLQSKGHKVAASELRVLNNAPKCIQIGRDFLERSAGWQNDLVTNPPYSHGRAEAFVRHSLHIADGKVCLLLDGGFLWSDKRSRRGSGLASVSPGDGLWRQYPPELVVIIPYRIYFHTSRGGTIEGQANNHAWFVWPERPRRKLVTAPRIIWAEDHRPAT